MGFIRNWMCVFNICGASEHLFWNRSFTVSRVCKLTGDGDDGGGGGVCDTQNFRHEEES
jgi:hypothetical protein